MRKRSLMPSSARFLDLPLDVIERILGSCDWQSGTRSFQACKITAAVGHRLCRDEEWLVSSGVGLNVMLLGNAPSSLVMAVLNGRPVSIIERHDRVCRQMPR